MSLSYATAIAIKKRVDTRNIQTLLGLCSGLIADKNLNDQEIVFLKTWLLQHDSIINEWPASAIYYRINAILEDGIVTDEERSSLVLLLQELTGNEFLETGSADAAGPVLPIDDDPSIFFNNMSYCFTGEFLHGTRAACERTILKLGAMPVDRVTKKLNYLVIGSRISDAWRNTTYGAKIEQAVKLRDEGHELIIISERQWDSAIRDTIR